ncbi:MAG: hypothetical protein ACOX4F_05465 [Atopobiaceae bacterium]
MLRCERALDLVHDAFAQADGAMYTLGPLIHNPQVVSELEERGIKAIDEPAQAHGATLVMRTHGVTPQVEQAAHDAGAKIVDATCPYVKKAHRAAERMAHDGYQVIIVGEKGHPEVEGTLGPCPRGSGNCQRR